MLERMKGLEIEAGRTTDEPLSMRTRHGGTSKAAENGGGSDHMAAEETAAEAEATAEADMSVEAEAVAEAEAMQTRAAAAQVAQAPSDVAKVPH